MSVVDRMVDRRLVEVPTGYLSSIFLPPGTQCYSLWQGRIHHGVYHTDAEGDPFVWWTDVDTHCMIPRLLLRSRAASWRSMAAAVPNVGPTGCGLPAGPPPATPGHVAPAKVAAPGGPAVPKLPARNAAAPKPRVKAAPKPTVIGAFPPPPVKAAAAKKAAALIASLHVKARSKFAGGKSLPVNKAPAVKARSKGSK